MAIVTEAEVKYTGSVESGADSTELSLCIDAAEDACEQYVGYKFGRIAKATHAEYHDAEAERKVIVLDYRNIDSANIDVFYDSAWEYAAADELASTSYTVDTDWGLVHLISPYGSGARRWKVAYTGGWDATDNRAPAGLRFATGALAAIYYNRMKNAHIGIAQERSAEAPLAYDPLIPQDVKAMLAGYVRVVE